MNSLGYRTATRQALCTHDYSLDPSKSPFPPQHRLGQLLYTEENMSPVTPFLLSLCSLASVPRGTLSCTSPITVRGQLGPNRGLVVLG